MTKMNVPTKRRTPVRVRQTLAHCTSFLRILLDMTSSAFCRCKENRQGNTCRNGNHRTRAPMAQRRGHTKKRDESTKGIRSMVAYVCRKDKDIETEGAVPDLNMQEVIGLRLHMVEANHRSMVFLLPRLTEHPSMPMLAFNQHLTESLDYTLPS